MEALPLSLSEADGTFKKSPKSALLHKLEQDVEPVSDLPTGCFGAFGVYLDNSIKDVERNRRSCGELKLQQIIPDAEIKQWALLLSSNDN